MERIQITNFAGIKRLDIELNQFNVFIGKQASGKSVTAKLIYFFKGVVYSYLSSVRDKKSKEDINESLISKFVGYFPTDTWHSSPFELTYSLNDSVISINNNDGVKIYFSEDLEFLYKTYFDIISTGSNNINWGHDIAEWVSGLPGINKLMDLTKQKYNSWVSDNLFFAPAGRSFFANLQKSIFSLLSTNRSKAMDPFLLEFGAFYETIKAKSSKQLGKKDDWFKKIQTLFNELSYSIIAGDYLRENDEDYLVHEDNRKIILSLSSSGQQETLPLLLMIRSFLLDDGWFGEFSVFIEEPETHLFPSAQKNMVEMMALAFNRSRSPLQLTITTHSPYILTSLNNLIQAGTIIENASSEIQNKVFEIVRNEFILNYRHVSAFAFKDGTATSIIDQDTHLISAEYLDSISEQIGMQFDDLLNIG